MSGFIEDGNKPVKILPCYVRCPYCNHMDNYQQTAVNTGFNERSIIKCTNVDCGKNIEVVGNGDGTLTVKGVL